MTTIERVARAIAGELNRQDGYDPSPAFTDGLKVDFLRQGRVDFALVARAAIEASREPTKPMKEAGKANVPWSAESEGGEEVDIWQAMIDAALEEQA